MPMAYTIEYSVGTRRRKLELEPRSDGEGYWFVESEWTGCAWRTVGREPVADVTVEGADVIA
jgi:hypothetical protein